jgi:hypothetical protein
MSRTDLTNQYFARLHTFMNASNNETDRGRALVAASLIEEMLEEILRSFLREGSETSKLFEAPNAPLSSLHSKALLSRSLCLISAAEFKDIDLIRRIRNEFAHSILCSFEDAKIVAWAKDLKAGMGILDVLDSEHESRVEDPKQRFGMVTISVVSTLYNCAHYVEKKKIVETDYPD